MKRMVIIISLLTVIGCGAKVSTDTPEARTTVIEVKTPEVKTPVSNRAEYKDQWGNLWAVGYIVYTNMAHNCGYVILTSIWKGGNPCSMVMSVSNYIHTIHKNIGACYSPAVPVEDFRTAECLVICSMAGNMDIKSILKVKGKMHGRRYGLRARR